MSATVTRSEIEAFWATPRLAVVGVSRDPKEFGYRLYSDLKQWGYQAFPVNPQAKTIGEDRAYARVQDINPGVEAALLLTSPSANEEVVRDCAAAGVKRIWFYGVSDRSDENAAAITYCREHGIDVVPGYCPYMFMPQAPFFHKIHGFVARVTGHCPR